MYCTHIRGRYIELSLSVNVVHVFTNVLYDK